MVGMGSSSMDIVLIAEVFTPLSIASLISVIVLLILMTRNIKRPKITNNRILIFLGFTLGVLAMSGLTSLYCYFLIRGFQF